MAGSIAAAVMLVAQTVLMWRRLLAYLRYFQQEAYETVRFLRWVTVRSFADPALWLAVAGSVLVSGNPLTVAVIVILGVTALGVLQPDPRRSGKVPLKLTWRATRVLGVSLVLATAVSIASAIWPVVPGDLRSVLIASASLLAAAPFLLLIANACLMPYERHIQNTYEARALQRVHDTHPLIVGITGSYGKSSTKAILAHILQYQGPTLAASGSINTLMGVTRHIRQELVSGHQFMIVEMGAFRAGSIRRLCQLTPPSAGIITAVGDMHLERFGSTEEIVRAKGELAAAIPAGGFLVVNADSPGALRIARQATHCRVLLYGEQSSEELDTRVEELTFSKSGSTFVLCTRSGRFSSVTPLLGRPIVLNIAGAFTLASALGVDPHVILAALSTLRPVPNRLEVVDVAGVTWIRDAYNSNQFGFRAALEVAAALPAAHRFLATPGVIELGPGQFDVNRALAREAAAVCDTTLVVSLTNREAFLAGFRDAGREDRLVLVPTRTEAFRWLHDHVKEGDGVILENDLPDLYERSEGLFWKAS